MLWNVSTVSNSGGLIAVTTTVTNTLVTGQFVQIEGVTGTTEANGNWKITTISSSQFTLNGSTFVHGYVNGGIVYRNQNWNGKFLGLATSYISGSNSTPSRSSNNPSRTAPVNISGIQAGPLMELMMPSTGAVKYFQMRGWYVSGEIYETWVVSNVPSSVPPSGHILIDVEIAATWTQ